MADVLKTEPGVSDVKIGVSVGPNPADSGLMIEYERDWIHPFIDYTKSKGIYHYTIRFVSLRDARADQFSFMTMLSGLSAVGERPDDWGTRAVMAKWKAVCGVDASVLYN